MLPFGIGIPELVIIGVVAVMLFGSRLPEVAKTLGGSYAQFRRSLDDIKSTFNADISSASLSNIPHYTPDEDDFEPETPVFDPPPSDDVAVPPADATDPDTSISK